MEKSSMNNTIIEDTIAEESGWTAYLEDFSCSNSVISNPSLISDAAWNGSHAMIRPLNFNKLKKINNLRKYSYDDDLEDTASSPVNSPKVSSMRQMEVNYNMRSTDDIAASGNFLGKQAISNNFWKQDREEKNVIEDKNMDKLRKRGLCLVPMSTLINYLG